VQSFGPIRKYFSKEKDRGLISKKGRGSSEKSTGADRFVVCLTSAPTDLSRPMQIRWLRTRGEGCGGAGSPVCGVRGGAPPDFTEMVFPGSKQRGIESGRTYASCVIHPWHFLASGRLWSGDAMEAEALRGGPRRRAAYRRPGQVLAYGH